MSLKDFEKDVVKVEAPETACELETKINKPSREDIIKITMNNINIVGRILVEENGLINEFLQKKTLIVNENTETFKQELENISKAMGVAAKYFDDKYKGLEDELKSITKK